MSLRHLVSCDFRVTTSVMADIIFIAVALAFFALCALYVRWCDRIIGPDVFVVAEPADDAQRSRDRRGGGMIAVAGYDNWVGLSLASSPSSISCSF